MPSSNVTPIDSIQQRRKQLKKQKRLRSLAAIWRTGVLCGLTGSLAWGLTLPDWIISQPGQVKIVGNQYLKTERIQALLPLTYPQSLLRLNPEHIITGLGQALPLQYVTIARHLFPPTLIVQIHEFPPVAVALCDRCIISSPSNIQQGPASQWLVDAKGQVAPRSSFNPQALTNLKDYPELLGYFVPAPAPTASDTPSPSTPAPNVTTPPPDQAQWQISPDRQEQWQQLYPLLLATQLKITQIDWRNPNNLVLQTELGRVHLGTYSDRIPAQLTALKQLQQLPQYLNPNQLVHIDLVNPAEPLLQMKTTVVRPNAAPNPPGPTLSPTSPSPTPSVTPSPIP